MRQKSISVVKRYGGKLAKNSAHHARKSVHVAAKSVRIGASQAKRVATVSTVHAAKSYKLTHHHLVQRPHQKLVQHVGWYRRWHEWQWHRFTHYAALSLYTLVIGVMLFNTFRVALAADLNDTWNFSTPTDFAFDSGLETSGSVARLKAQNYTADSNTKALYHLDDGSGSNLSDSSGSANPATASGSPSWVTGNLQGGLQLNGSTQYAQAADSSSLSLSQQNSIEGWTKFGSSFGNNTHSQDQTVVDKGSYKLYYDRTTGKVTYELANSAATSWTKQAGNDIKGSWDTNGKSNVLTQVAIGSNIYAGLGIGTGDAEVWKWSGTSWTQIGGDGKNSSWADQTFESVASLAVNGNTLYAGLGTGIGDAEVWSCDTSSGCSTWTKIGGDALDPGSPGNASWASATYESVESMTYMGGYLYVGLGNSAQDGEVWRFNPSNSDWTKIGGDGVNPGGGASWTTLANVEDVYSLVNDGTYLYAGLGNSTNDAAVWRFNPSTNAWSQLGGQSCCGSWGAVHENALSMTTMSGSLYVGLGTGTADAEVWRFDGTNWAKIGGDGTGWADLTYEGVYSLTNDGTNVYAGLGYSTGDNEVWKWNGSTWSQIGGDTINGGFNGSGTNYITSLLYTGGNLYSGHSVNGTNATGEVWRFNGTSWSRLGGNFLNLSWGVLNYSSIDAMTASGNYLYAGTGGAYADIGQVWRFDGSTWELIGGMGLNSSWPAYTYEGVYSLINYKGDLYAGLGVSTNDAEVWKWNGTTWTQVGGDGLNSGWSGIQRVSAMTIYNNEMYVGLYGSVSEGRVYKWNGTSWTYVGGNTVSGGYNAWPAGYEAITSLSVVNNKIYAGMASSTGDADVWQLSGTTWTQVGGDGLNSGWAAATYENVDSMVAYNGNLYAGIGTSTGDAEVWKYNGSTWAKIGGDDSGGATTWSDGQYEQVRSLAVYNGELYAGLGSSTGDGEVWKYNGSTWTKSAGGGVNSSWAAATVSYVPSMSDYKGKLYVAAGGMVGSNNNPQIWSLGSNGFLQSAVTTQDTSWHHIAATYDGATMKLYIDGTLNNSTSVSLSIPDNSYPLLIGTNYGGSGAGEQQGFLAGSIDEIRISDTARSSFTTLPYSNSAQKVTLASAVRLSGVRDWEGFSASEIANGGSIKYRLSIDGGTTWKYWTGSSWGASSSTSESNTASVINSNISTLPVTFGGIMWQAVLLGDGTQQVTLNSVTVTSNSDNVEPSTNASAVQAYKSNGGASLASNGWTNGSSPYFTWTAGSDAGSGIKGYCLYLGTDNTADPVTTKGMLGASPVTTGGHCQFLIASSNIDFATAGYLNTALTTSSSPYYLRIKAIDNAGNVYSASTAQFQFRFDNTPPSNPGYITAPSGFINTKTANLTWSTVGGQAPADSNSGVAGLQYRVNNTTWYGDGHTGSGDINDLLTNDGDYTTADPPDFDNINEGVNTVYFRTWDQAGNVTSSYVSAALKVNTNGSPTEPQNVAATPSTNTTNSFSFDWDEPATYVGSVSNLTYCYTINTLPSANTCTFTSAGVTSLGSEPYATQPGSNTFYVVARDESSNINYANYASTTFTANTSAPGIPTNADVIDVSIKSTNSWRLALTWEQPANIGSGITSYKVYRSTSNVSFSFVGSSSSTTYIDANLSQQTYYYRVRACDNTNNCGAESGTVHMLPTGKFTSPADMTSEPTVSNITTKRARINWSTDRGSDSKISIGTSSGQYSPSEVGNSSQVTSHVIDLDNLAAGTTYYFRAKWTDEDGNTATSEEYSFTTSPAPQLKEVVTLKTTLTGAIIQFSTKDATKANLYFGKSDAFGGLKSINTSASESTYGIELTGLDDGTKYYYKISTFDDENGEYQGTIFSFTTPARPRISNLKFQPVQGEPTSTQKVTWDTNVPTTTTITYGKLNTSGTDIQQSQLVTAHEIVIRQLEDDSQYFLIASGRDADGNLSASDRQQFHTALDTRSPKVTEVVTEPSIKGSGAEARGQIVVSWKTDEPSTSQVAYAEGSSSTSFNSKTAEDTQLTTEHLVIVSDLSTSRVFSIQPVSKDKAGNAGTGEPQSAIIGRASDSVLTIILNTLRRVFGI